MRKGTAGGNRPSARLTSPNHAGEALTESRQYSIGRHPVSFSESYFVRLDTALAEIDRHLAADDKAPVIYAWMSDRPKAFPRP